MALHVVSVTVDSTDPLPLAQWWADRLDAQIVATNDGWFIIVSGGNAPGQLAFQKVDEVTPGKNSWHLDLGASDRAAAVAELVAAGNASELINGNPFYLIVGFKPASSSTASGTQPLSQTCLRWGPSR